MGNLKEQKANHRQITISKISNVGNLIGSKSGDCTIGIRYQSERTKRSG